MSDRTYLFDQLTTPPLSAVPAARVYSFGTREAIPQKPFVMYRLLDKNITIAGVAFTQVLEVWAHDEVGSYVRIDSILKEVKGRLEGPVVGETGLNQIRFDGLSGDLFDDGFKSNTKYAQFTLVGKEA